MKDRYRRFVTRFTAGSAALNMAGNGRALNARHRFACMTKTTPAPRAWTRGPAADSVTPSNAIQGLGVNRGDRRAIILPQRPDCDRRKRRYQWRARDPLSIRSVPRLEYRMRDNETSPRSPRLNVQHLAQLRESLPPKERDRVAGAREMIFVREAASRKIVAPFRARRPSSGGTGAVIYTAAHRTPKRVQPQRVLLGNIRLPASQDSFPARAISLVAATGVTGAYGCALADAL